jgi:hypothetical protein
MRACGELWAYRAMGRLGNYGVAGVVILCAGFLFWQRVPGPFAPLLAIGVLVFVAMDLLRGRLWRRHFRSLRKYEGPITATVAAPGVGVSSLEGDHHLPWNRFLGFARTDSFLFLLVDQRQFSVIPLDAFASIERAAAFESILSSHLRRLPRRFL